MTPLPLDFSTPSLARTWARTALLTRCALLMGLLLCASLAFAMVSLVRQQTDVRHALRDVQAKHAERNIRQPTRVMPGIDPAQASAVNAAVSQLNLPWRDVLDAIDAATPSTIALLSIEPDARKRLVRGSAEAKNSEAMIAYVESLKKQGYFSDVTLSRHEINEQDPNAPLRFQFEAQWRSGAP